MIRVWVRSNLLVAFGVVGSALTLFGSLEPLLKLSRLSLWLVEHWRQLVQTPWIWLGSIIHIEISAALASFFSLWVFVVLFVARSSFYLNDQATVRRHAFQKLLIVLSVPIFLITASILIVRPDDWYSIGITVAVSLYASVAFPGVRRAHTVLLLVPMILVLACVLYLLNDKSSMWWNIIYYAVFCYAILLWLVPIMRFIGSVIDVIQYPDEPKETYWLSGATNAMRATMLVLILLGLNWIGFHAPAIKTWIDEVTSLPPP